MSQLSNFLIDPATPGGLAGAQGTASNLNQAADRNLQRAQIAAQKELAMAELKARAKMQEVGIAADSAENQKAREQQEMLARLQLEEEGRMQAAQNSFVKELEQERNRFGLVLNKLRIDAARASDEAAMAAYDKEIQRYEQMEAELEEKLAASTMAFQSVKEGREIDLNALEGQIKQLMEVRSMAEKNSFEFASAGVLEGVVEAEANAPTLIQDPAGVAGKAVARIMGNDMAANASETTPVMLSRVAERVASNLSASGVAGGVNPVEVQSELTKVIQAADAARMMIEGVVDTEAEREAQRVLAEAVKSAREKLGDSVLSGVSRALREYAPSTGGEAKVSKWSIQGVKELNKVGLLISSAASTFDGGGAGLNQKMDVEKIKGFLVNYYDRLYGGDAGAVVDQLVRSYQLTRREAADLYETVKSRPEKSLKQLGNEQEETRGELKKLERKAGTASQRATLRAGAEGNRQMSEGLSRLIDEPRR